MLLIKSQYVDWPIKKISQSHYVDIWKKYFANWPKEVAVQCNLIIGLYLF
jgi:hypothetical protein